MKNNRQNFIQKIISVILVALFFITLPNFISAMNLDTQLGNLSTKLQHLKGKLGQLKGVLKRLQKKLSKKKIGSTSTHKLFELTNDDLQTIQTALRAKKSTASNLNENMKLAQEQKGSIDAIELIVSHDILSTKNTKQIERKITPHLQTFSEKFKLLNQAIINDYWEKEFFYPTTDKPNAAALTEQKTKLSKELKIITDAIRTIEHEQNEKARQAQLEAERKRAAELKALEDKKNEEKRLAEAQAARDALPKLKDHIQNITNNGIQKSNFIAMRKEFSQSKAAFPLLSPEEQDILRSAWRSLNPDDLPAFNFSNPLMTFLFLLVQTLNLSYDDYVVRHLKLQATPADSGKEFGDEKFAEIVKKQRPIASSAPKKDVVKPAPSVEASPGGADPADDAKNAIIAIVRLKQPPGPPPPPGSPWDVSLWPTLTNNEIQGIISNRSGITKPINQGLKALVDRQKAEFAAQGADGLEVLTKLGLTP